MDDYWNSLQACWQNVQADHIFYTAETERNLWAMSLAIKQIHTILKWTKNSFSFIGAVAKTEQILIYGNLQCIS